VTTVPDQPSDQNSSPVTPRGEGTRARIVDAAMRLFEERGYERTTMRAVASEAGVSLGNAYYYFASKEELVQGFYHRIQDRHALAAGPRMQGLTAFADRLTAAELAFVDVAEPYHRFAARFFAVAADPASPLSPFSDASRGAREASQRIFVDVVAGSDLKADARVLAELPELLWLAHLGMVLRWVHDRSEGQAATRTLVRRSVPLVDRLCRLSRLRPLRPVVHEVLDLASDLRSPG
jgi:AcrR family transcriptional regulator